MNATYLELSEKLDCLFPASLHKINCIYFKTYLNVRYTDEDNLNIRIRVLCANRIDK